jgi:hypothetical protein
LACFGFGLISFSVGTLNPTLPDSLVVVLDCTLPELSTTTKESGRVGFNVPTENEIRPKPKQAKNNASHHTMTIQAD